MSTVVFPGDSLSSLCHELQSDARESGAILLARSTRVGAGNWRLLVESVHVASNADYELRTGTAMRLSPAFRLLHEKRARLEGLSLVYCHSHPSEQGIPTFSPVDDATEIPLAKYCRERIQRNIPHVSLLVGAETVRARLLGGHDLVTILEVGRRVTRWFPGNDSPIRKDHDRQVRAFGEEGQRTIQSMRIAIVGLGGTGSVVAQQLAHLGVSRFLLIDPQTLEDTNLNRVVGALPSDVGTPKVSIARRMIRRIVPGAHVSARKANVLDEATGLLLRDVDFVFCCTDSHGSRLFISRLAYQYFVPCIDMGTIIQVHNGEVSYYGTQVKMLAPGLSCLVCTDGLLDPNEVRWDLSSDHQRQADPYFQGRVDIKQPSVISLNSSAASHAVTMFLAAVAGIPLEARHQVFRGIRGDMRLLDVTPRPGCVNCSVNAYFGKGANYKLPVRAH